MNLIDLMFDSNEFDEKEVYTTDPMSPDDVEISIQNLPVDTRVTTAFIQ